MAAMTLDLEDPWDALYQSIGTVGDAVMSTVSQAIEWAENHLGNISIHHSFTNYLVLRLLTKLSDVNRRVRGSRF
jgi:hypothetical protein